MKRTLTIISLLILPLFWGGGMVVNPYRFAAVLATFSFDFTTQSNANPWSDANFTAGPGATGPGQIFSAALFAPADNACVRVLESAATFSANQRCDTTPSLDEVGPAVRISSTSDGSCYYAARDNGNVNQIIVWKVVDTGSLTITQVGSPIASTASGSTGIGLSASGTGSTVTLSVYNNGTFVGSVTDSSSPLVSGQPGVYLHWQFRGMTTMTATDL